MMRDDVDFRSVLAMPTIPFGDHRLSRLVLGANPINGGSHLSRFVDRQMKAYYDDARILATLDACWREGINAWQSGPLNLSLYETYRKQGGTLHYVSLGSERDGGDVVARVGRAGATAIAHHGEVTDVMFREGRLCDMVPFLQNVRDAGLMVGVSTHIPDVVDAVESAGWPVDFYMTCVYERHRTRQQLQALLGHVPVRVGEVYLEDDPPRMFRAMRQTDKPCLAFKILAAGRLCERQEMVEAAFRKTFAQIKPNDAVIVGMYPLYEDQIRLDADYVRRFSSLSGE